MYSSFRYQPLYDEVYYLDLSIDIVFEDIKRRNDLRVQSARTTLGVQLKGLQHLCIASEPDFCHDTFHKNPEYIALMEQHNALVKEYDREYTYLLTNAIERFDSLNRPYLGMHMLFALRDFSQNYSRAYLNDYNDLVRSKELTLIDALLTAPEDEKCTSYTFDADFAHTASTLLGALGLGLYSLVSSETFSDSVTWFQIFPYYSAFAVASYLGLRKRAQSSIQKMDFVAHKMHSLGSDITSLFSTQTKKE